MKVHDALQAGIMAYPPAGPAPSLCAGRTHQARGTANTLSGVSWAYSSPCWFRIHGLTGCTAQTRPATMTGSAAPACPCQEPIAPCQARIPPSQDKIDSHAPEPPAHEGIPARPAHQTSIVPVGILPTPAIPAMLPSLRKGRHRKHADAAGGHPDPRAARALPLSLSVTSHCPCHYRWNNVWPPSCRSGRNRCWRPSPCWTKAPPSPSLPATARKSPAIWMTPSCVTWTNASPTCASWMPAARPSWIRSPNRASSRRTWPSASTRPTASSGWKISTPPTSPSAAPRPRSPARPDWSRWPMRCWPTPHWCPKPRQPPT